MLREITQHFTGAIMKGIGTQKSAKHKNDDDGLACIMSDSPHMADQCRSLTSSKHVIIKRIREGLPGEMVVGLAKKMRVPQKDVAVWLHTTTRTVQRHIEGQEKLSPEISDRLAQLILVYCRCNEVFQDEDKASTWLKTPNFALGGATPSSLLDTTLGIELVFDELGRIEHGVFI